METIGLRTATFVQAHAAVISGRITRIRTAQGRQERGEGVISAALVVLIIAFLAVAMWIAYKQMFDQAADATAKKVSEIGQ